MISTQIALPSVRLPEVLVTGVCGGSGGATSAHCAAHFKCCESLVALVGATYLRIVGLYFSGAFMVALWVSPIFLELGTKAVQPAVPGVEWSWCHAQPSLLAVRKWV